MPEATEIKKDNSVVCFLRSQLGTDIGVPFFQCFFLFHSEINNIMKMGSEEKTAQESKEIRDL